jgi:hypothetical protein
LFVLQVEVPMANKKQRTIEWTNCSIYK